jgi:hypothetical protein
LIPRSGNRWSSGHFVNRRSNHAVDPVRISIQFVSSGVKDTNDGHDWGSAKLTIMAAYDGLPDKGGTIYIASDFDAAGTGGPCCFFHTLLKQPRPF